MTLISYFIFFHFAVVKLGWSTCYIVCGLVVRDGKVLMIQEAKQSCRGMWYMPAGRMEKGESLEVQY